MLDHAPSDGFRHDGGGRCDTEFGAQALAVPLDGLRAQAEPVGDFGSLLTLGKHGAKLGRKNAKAGEFAIWNGFTLQVKYDGDVLYECTNIKVGIPDSAFEKNLDTSWAK